MPSAQRAAGRAVEQDPQLAEAHRVLGVVLHYSYDPWGAERELRRALRLRPDLAEARAWFAYNVLAIAFGRFDEAIEELEQARKLGANSARLHTNLGSLYMQSGMSANGLLAFRRAVRADPADYGANLNLVMYYAQTGDMRQVLQWARAAKEANAERPEAALFEARALIGLGRRAEAAGVLRDLLGRHPGSAAGEVSR